MYYEPEFYNEPTEADMLLHEYQEKMGELIKPNIRKQLEDKDTQIASLKQKNYDLESKHSQLSRQFKESDSKHEDEIERVKKNIVREIGETLGKTYYAINTTRSEEVAVTYIDTEKDGVKIKVTTKTHPERYASKEFDHRFITSVKIKGVKDLVITWNNSDYEFDAQKITIHKKYIQEEISGNYWEHIFETKSDADKYASYLNSKEEPRVMYEVID